MAAQIPLIRIFLSSPGDVGEERRLAQQVIKELPNRPSFRYKLSLAAVAWDDLESSTPMEASLSPQAAINQGLPQPAACEITVVIFWSRLGSPFEMEGQAYESGTHWELLNALGSPCRTLIYRRTQEPDLGKPSSPDFRKKLDQYDRLEAFLKGPLFYNERGHILRAITEHESPAAFEKRFSLDLEALLVKLLAGPLPATPAPDPAPQIIIAQTEAWPPGKSPFPGLRAFQKDDAPIFFGRGYETDQLVRQAAKSRLVAVVGASGSGKSSLVGAGLIPRLAANAITGSKDWAVLNFKPGQKPFEALYEQMLRAFPAIKPNPLEAPRIKANFLASLQDSPEAFLDICQAALEESPPWAEVLLFVDQFEELFTLCGPGEQAAFVRLLTAIHGSQRVRALLTLRHDFFNKAVENTPLSELLRGEAVFSLSTPRRDALREMIERPASLAELSLEAGLVKQLLDDTGDEPGNLALLAYTLDELYKLAEGGQISLEHYESLGGVQGAIGTRAENTFLDLGLDEGRLFQVFQGLVEVDERGTATRQRAQFDPQAESAALGDLIAGFTQARLLTTDYDPLAKQATVEVAHEAILRNWKRLADWIEKTQDEHRALSRMKREARLWDEKGRPDHLRPNAETLAEFWAACQALGAVIENDPLLLDFTEAEQERLYRELRELNTSHRRRFDIGERLARIGDTRPGIGLLPDGRPEILWLPVQGSGGQKIAFPDEDGEVYGEFLIRPFYIAQYLITHAQYAAFAEGGDYENPRWWAGFPKSYRPQPLSIATNGNPNAPRDNLSWYQAVACGCWLTAQFEGLVLPGLEGEVALQIGHNAEIRLPTEWEFQWVAQGGRLERAYPWGDWDKYPRANTTEAAINDRSTAVGMYPEGAAACGALDLAGNLWKWCLNKYSSVQSLAFDESSDSRSLRGGAFSSYHYGAAARFRYYNYPYVDDRRFGCVFLAAPPPSAL